MKSGDFQSQQPTESLWTQSSAWRWLLTLTVLSAAVFMAAKPWQADKSAKAGTLASYSAPRPQPVTQSQMLRPSTGAVPQQQKDAIASTDTLDAKGAMQAFSPSAGSPRVSNTHQVSSPVRWANNNNEGSISGGGLIASYCCAGPFSTVQADTGVTSGRHYLELTISVRPGAQNPDTWTQAGITLSQSGRQVLGDRSSGGNSYSVISWGQNKAFSHGDVVMMALDMDKGQFYWGVNGRWRNGDPEGSTGDPLVAGKAYRPFVSISSSSKNLEGDKWIANFGSRPFKYQIPAGYASYGTYSRAVSVASSQPPSNSMSGAGSGSNPFFNQSFSNQITLLGKTLPLPDGRWRGIGYMQIAANQDEMVALAKIEHQKLAELVAVRVQTVKGKKGNGAQQTCDRREVFAKSVIASNPDGTQLCWWVNHAAQVWNQPLFNLSGSNLSQLSVPLPNTLVNTAFHKADFDSAITVFYYSNPESAGISTINTNWQSSEWHKDRVEQYPEKLAYLKKRELWAESWLPIIKAMK